MPGKELHFLILIAFVCSFGFIRGSAHMIRAQVSWWPGNVETKGGTHIHHLVWGILLLLVMGYLGLAWDPPSPWIELVAIGFGIGMGLTMDEFALWLNLQDVYWAPKGRQSIDAVVVTTTLLVIAVLNNGLTLLNVNSFWQDVARGGELTEPSLFLAYGVTGVFLTIDLAFFGANIIKIHRGGWVPLRRRQESPCPAESWRCASPIS